MTPLAPVSGGLPVDVSVVHLDLDGGDLEVSRSLLDAGERARAERILREVDARRWIRARARLRHVLACRLGADPRALVFTGAAGGKPRLDPPWASLRFNLSHTGGDALVATSFARDVGVDLERLDRRVEAERLAGRHFTPAEREAVAGAGDEEAGRRAFLRLWVRKEALAKALGVGIATDLSALDPAAHAGWTTLDLDAPRGLVGAVSFEHV